MKTGCPGISTWFIVHYQLGYIYSIAKSMPAGVNTEDAGLPYFDRAAVKAKGNWYYSSALEPMGAKLCFCYSSITIGPSYK